MTYTIGIDVGGTKVLGGVVDETGKIVRWTMRGIDAAGQKRYEHDPMGEDKVRYITPPCPYVHYIMVEFKWSRSKAEFIASIT